MSGKNSKRLRRKAEKLAMEASTRFIMDNGPLIMDRAIQAIKGLPLEERQKIADAIIRGNDA
jgi:hypothetical protein